MPRKQWFLLAVALLLVLVYVWYFTGWFQYREIHISSTSRPALSRGSAGGPSANVAFGLDREYRLTELKVVPLAAWQTNPAAMPVWHLVGHAQSAPVKIFLYGRSPRGMQPAVAGAKPEPLEDGIAYRLFVSAGSVKGQHDFWIGGKPAEGTNPASH